MTAGTVVFDRADDGTPAREWVAAGLADRAAPLDLTGAQRLVVLSAHPDDETLGAGGLLRLAGTRGMTVDVVLASDGEGSHPGSPTLRPDRLAELRRGETDRAMAHLAPDARVHRLGRPDGALAGEADLADAVRSAVGPLSAGTLIAAPWRDDGHPDHRAVALAADEIARAGGATLIEYPIWAWHWARPDDPRLHPSRLAVLRLDGDTRHAKARAIGEHRSQITDLSAAPADRAVLRERFLAHFRGAGELYVPAGGSLPAGYFDALYRAGDDPWALGRHWYERRKRALTVAALPRPRFRSAFEPGCATGLLTEQLARRCDALLATDIAAAPVVTARRRFAGQPHVVVEQRAIPRDWPEGEFDLVVLSEIGYYLDRADLSRVIARAAASLTPDGFLVACHWRHPAPGYPLRGDAVHAALVAESGLTVVVSQVEEDFRLDVLARPGTPSVARWEGVLR